MTLASFEHAPVSLWLEDYSALKSLFEIWRAEGVRDLRAYLQSDPARITACTATIKVIAVNQRTLELFEAPDQQTLIRNLPRVFRDDMLAGHVEELVQLWDGAQNFLGNSVNYTLGDKRLDIEIRGVILPGHSHDWARVLVVIDDVTKREEARRAG